jgi:hypothetical protein
MGKAEVLSLFGSVDSVEAGFAVSYVEGLDNDDPRLLRPYLKKPLNLDGYWIHQQKMATAHESEFHPC